jgi:hypothetical protein
MKIVIDIPTDQYNEIVYVNYERLRDIVRDGVVIEKCEDAVSREAALLALTGIDLPTDRDKLIALFTNRIQHLPSVTPRTNLAETSQDCISILNRIMEYTYGMLTAEKIGLQHLIKSMMDELSGGDSE